MEVVNLRKESYTLYIGRGSFFGNPFRIGKDGNREEVIKKFEQYARNKKPLLDRIRILPKDIILGCYCKPKACHGDIIIKIWKELHHEI